MNRSVSDDAEDGSTGDTLTPVTPDPDSVSLRLGASRPRRVMVLRRTAGSVALAGALLVTGCGGDGSSTAGDDDSAIDAERAGAAPLDAEAAAAIDLKVVADGSQVSLADVAATDRPTLLWFWAPF